MKILVVGGGGREHAICHRFRQSQSVREVYCANGNAGISGIATIVSINPNQTAELVTFARQKSVDLTFIGGENPLAGGVVDSFRAAGLAIVGPTRLAARLESSKGFAKDFMNRHRIPTARYRVADSAIEAAEILDSGYFGGEELPVVVKADGLAAGKGVVVAENRQEALAAIQELAAVAGREAAGRIVLEERLVGREVSLILFAAGEKYALMPPTRDYKRLLDNDRGPNTGGMGTFTDDDLLSDDEIFKIRTQIIEPTLSGCVEENFPFSGVLFLGLMITADGPKVLEYNVRFGDPETQSILVRLETDLAEIAAQLASGTLEASEVRWRKHSSATVILAAEGYPRNPRLGDPIIGLEEAAKVPDVKLFHSGTAFGPGGEFVTAGGRVIGVTATDATRRKAIERAYSAARLIDWPGRQMRSDIGRAV
ncbi:MAG: phosphoribosylamine--glycine ligase [Blastocatellia bacterium]